MGGGALPPPYGAHTAINTIELQQGMCITLMAVTDTGSMPATGWYILS